MDNKQKSDMASSTKDAASTEGSVARDLRNAASQKFDETVSEARSQANEAKDSVAGEVKDVALALRNAADGLRDGSAQERTLGMVANGLADASDALHDKDLGEIVQAVNRIARDNPVLFLGGAVLLGFAASRYAKATGDNGTKSRTQHRSEQNNDDFVNEGNPNTQPVEAAT